MVCLLEESIGLIGGCVGGLNISLPLVSQPSSVLG